MKQERWPPTACGLTSFSITLLYLKSFNHDNKNHHINEWAALGSVHQSCLTFRDPPARLLSSHYSPGKNTAVDCHVFLHIFLTQGTNLHLPSLLHCRQSLNPLGHLGSPYQWLLHCPCFWKAPFEGRSIMAWTALPAFLSVILLSYTRCVKKVFGFTGITNIKNQIIL